MKATDLQKDHTYLLQFATQQTLTSVTILMVSEKAFNVRWNNNNLHETWELADKFCNYYTLIEDITNLSEHEDKHWVKDLPRIDVNKPTTIATSTKLIKCHICHGMGTVRDTRSTAGTITCPACNGAKMIPEVITLTQQE